MEEISVGVVVDLAFQASVGLSAFGRKVGIIPIPVIQIVLFIVRGAGHLVASEKVAGYVRVIAPCRHFIFALGVECNKRNVCTKNTPAFHAEDPAAGVVGIRVDRGQLGAAAGI